MGTFSDIACSIISCLAVGIFMPKNSIIVKFCYLALGVPVIMRHRVDAWLAGRCWRAAIINTERKVRDNQILNAKKSVN